MDEYGGDEKATHMAPMPASLADSIIGYDWRRDAIGASDSRVYRLHGRVDAPDLFLKHGKDKAANEIDAEMARLRWLAPRLPAPKLIQFHRTDDEAWLLVSALPGQTAG